MAFIELSAVGLRYASSSAAALDSVSFSIHEGEYVAVIGANGSGKSSMLKLMSGLIRPTSGEIRVAGLDASLPENARLLRSTLNLVFQIPQEQIIATVVEEDVAFGPENLGLPREEIARRVDWALAKIGLAAERRLPAHFLSAGQQQRLAVAGALAMRGRCIAFDEATAMLDPDTRRELLDYMDELHAQGVGIIHVTQDMGEAVRASRLLVMEGGRLIHDGSPESFFAAPSLPAGLEPPPMVLAARALGLEPRLRESPRDLAARIALGFLSTDRTAYRSRYRNAMYGPSIGAGLGSPNAKAAFVFERASHDYATGGSEHRPSLRDVSLCIPAGSHVALIGRTGSGKSSMLQLMNALALPTRGRVICLGLDTSREGLDLRSLRMRAPLAIQRPELALFELYAGDDVAYGPRNQGLAGGSLVARVRDSMDRLGLPYASFRDRLTRSLSGGEARKLALAGVLALDPEALLLDEPGSALDPGSRAELRDRVLAQRARGGTLVVSTHSMEEAARADLVAVLDEGRLAALAPPRDIFYKLYDPAWKLGMPLVCQLARALADIGIAPEASPLDLDELAVCLGGAR